MMGYRRILIKRIEINAIRQLILRTAIVDLQIFFEKKFASSIKQKIDSKSFEPNLVRP
jgi:hypothetical protein